jgi:hypothetical protein
MRTLAEGYEMALSRGLRWRPVAEIEGARPHGGEGGGCKGPACPAFALCQARSAHGGEERRGAAKA